MSALPLRDEELLRTEISSAQEELSSLEQNLREVDGELEVLAGQREQVELLDQVCGSLERLDELGAATLFWGEASATTSTAEHVRRVRGRMVAFQDQLNEIEARREAFVERIREGQEVLDILEDDLFELELAREESQREWLPEREVGEGAGRISVMPWSRSSEDDQRFRKSLAAALVAAILLGLIVPWIELPLPDLELVPEVPERFARLIQQELPPPPPPVVVEEAVPEPELVEPEPEPLLVEELPTEVPEVVQEPAPVVAEQPAPEPQREVRSAGILAFRDSFSSLADGGESTARLGAQARLNSAGEAEIGRTERSMVTSLGPGSSGGINLSSLSRDVGGGGGGQGIDGVEVGRVASSIGSGGTGDRPLSGGASAGRTDEEIQIVFDRYKAALYRLYNRELRNDPTLRGQIVLQLTIEADGSVSFCEVRSSDMNAPALEQQVVERVLTFDFGAKEGIAALTILYPIDFLPAA